MGRKAVYPPKVELSTARQNSCNQRRDGRRDDDNTAIAAYSIHGNYKRRSSAKRCGNRLRETDGRSACLLHQLDLFMCELDTDAQPVYACAVSWIAAAVRVASMIADVTSPIGLRVAVVSGVATVPTPRSATQCA